MNALLCLWCIARAASAHSLVGLYDAGALRAGDEGGFLWVPSPGMTRSCGPAKAPDGLGIFEAEALANAATPALVILLEAPEGAAPLDTDNVRVSLGLESPSFRLQPAVLPRSLAVTLDGDGAIRYRQLVRTQLEMELCLEHKVGRGWIGGDAHALRQAFLLDPPTFGPDRRFFGGQRDPVPALLGPPDACLVRGAGMDDAIAGGKGEGSLDLVPSDIWGASLRWCGEDDLAGAGLPPPPIPLRLSQAEAPREAPKRQRLVITLSAGERDEDVRYTLRVGDAALATDAALYSPVASDAGGPRLGIADLLARIPYNYPTTGPPEQPHRYTVLVVPNWQIVEGLRRIAQQQPEAPQRAVGEGVLDGVGQILSQPELLFVQVPGADGGWVNLTAALTGAPAGLRSWGYNAGMLAGRAPIALPGWAPVDDARAAQAQRAGRHSLFLGAAGLLLGIAWQGLRRLRDLWTPPPEERAAYWPGAQLPEDPPPPPVKP